MDVFPNSAAGASRKPEPGACKDEFLPGLNGGGGEDVSLEWLSMYMEDCFSATPSYTFTPQPNPAPTNTNTNTSSNNNHPPPQLSAPALPSQSKDKKRKTTHKTHNQALRIIPSDPPLLHQTHWLADSELIYPKKEYEYEEQSAIFAGGEDEILKGNEGGQQHRRCTHCLSQKTPQWRAGPEGPKTLCNACGVRFKSGRLLPEYRPAKSPTFVSYKHSNSHKKVMEMRRAFMPSTSK